jgi:large repetitive protein
LLYFSADEVANDIMLKGKIADNSDLDYFLVEHSLDGRNFSTLGKVEWTENKEYIFRHLAPDPAIHYYRLKMVGNDGNKTYSRIEMVQLGVNKTVVTGLVQNPVAGGMAVVNIFSEKAQSAEAAVFDMTGRLLIRQVITLSQGKNNSRISLMPLPSGQYRLLIRTADGVSKTIPLFR